jgi:hypothetical protein
LNKAVLPSVRTMVINAAATLLYGAPAIMRRRATSNGYLAQSTQHKTQ